MADKDKLERIRILKSRFTEVTRLAAAETTLDIYNVLKEVGLQVPGEMRTLPRRPSHDHDVRADRATEF
jgi:hypothetical protein